MPTPPPITIPQLDGETPRAYAARVEYLTMGPGRSIDRLLDRKGIKNGSHVRQWSIAYNWVESAAAYDQTMATLAAQAHAARYLADLDEYRERYGKAGRDLFTVAQSLLLQCARAIKGERIEGKDGKIYHIPAMELTPATLRTAVQALITAGDLEAHALRVSDLIPRLTSDDQPDQ